MTTSTTIAAPGAPSGPSGATQTVAPSGVGAASGLGASPGAGGGRPGRLLDPASVALLSNLRLKARIIVEGVLTGMHKSPHRGSSIEFAEHKEYSPGDDIRHVDWRAFGRLDKFYVKQFEDETDLRTHLVVDASGSMDFKRGGAVTKFDYARTQAAALAFLLQRQQDAAGVSLFASELDPFVPPRAGSSHLNECLRILEGAKAGGATRLPRSLATLADRIRGRNLIVVFSDFLEDATDTIAMLRRLRARRNDVVVFHLMDPHEVDFPFDDLTEFVGLEGEEPVVADCAGIRDTYLDVVAEHLGGLREELRRAGVEYRFGTTDIPHDQPLATFLRARMRL